MPDAANALTTGLPGSGITGERIERMPIVFYLAAVCIHHRCERPRHA